MYIYIYTYQEPSKTYIFRVFFMVNGFGERSSETKFCSRKVWAFHQTVRRWYWKLPRATKVGEINTIHLTLLLGALQNAWFNTSKCWEFWYLINSSCKKKAFYLFFLGGDHFVLHSGNFDI